MPIRATGYSRKSAADLLRGEDGVLRLSKPYLKQLCKEMEQYTTPNLNDQLYLHFKGFQRLEALEEYTGLRCLWLEGNGLSKLENLETLTELRGLYCQQNCIRVIENIEKLTLLDTLNLSNNSVSKIEGLEFNTALTTLNLAHNHISDIESLRGLLDCPSIRIVDLSNNTIADPDVLTVFEQMPELRVLNVMGNEFIRKIPHYRKTMIVRCKNLSYLDDRPIFPKERVCAEAFMEGGRQAEREAREKFVQAEREREARGIQHLLDIQARARQEAALGIDGDADRTDSEAEDEDVNENKPKDLPNIYDQMSGNIPQNLSAWEPAPDIESYNPEEAITGPKAADIDLFDDDDEYEMEPIETIRPLNRMTITCQDSDSEEDEDDDIANIPALECVDLETGEVSLGDAKPQAKKLIEVIGDDVYDLD
eukprot:m.22256 g.22256  ORF g.22256 m.22256 type:complete len:423 (-) comp7381_c0_seq1:4322-5590(-)